MKKETKEILHKLFEYLEENPEIRFTQALFNLKINNFADESNPENKNFLFKDNYNDSDETVLKRINNLKI